MSIISGIVTAVTTVAETVAASIAAAIAGPTLATVTTAVVTVGLVVGAGYLIYKGVKKLLDRAENYVDKRHEEENIPARFKFNTIRDDEDENEYESRRPDRSNSVAKKVYNLKDNDSPYTRTYDEFFDDIRRARNKEYCERIPGFYRNGKFIPNNRFDVEYYGFPTLVDDIYDDDIKAISKKRKKKKSNGKKKKSEKYIDAEFTDVVNDMYAGIGTTKERANMHLAILGLGPNPDTTSCLA